MPRFFLLVAALAAALGPPTPVTESGSPNSGSPGNARRARRRKATTDGLWLVFFSHAIGPDECPPGRA